MNVHWDPALFEDAGFAMAWIASENAGHQDKTFDVFDPRHFDSYAMVHTPIPLEKAKLIEKAHQAINDQWDLLESKGAWRHLTNG